MHKRARARVDEKQVKSHYYLKFSYELNRSIVMRNFCISFKVRGWKVETIESRRRKFISEID